MADPTASVRHQEVQMSMTERMEQPATESRLQLTTESRFDFVNPGYR